MRPSKNFCSVSRLFERSVTSSWGLPLSFSVQDSGTTSMPAPLGTDAATLRMYSEPSSTILNSSCAVRPMIDLIRSKSADLRPGSSTMMSVPFLMMVGSETPNLSTRPRIVSIPCRSA